MFLDSTSPTTEDDAAFLLRPGHCFRISKSPDGSSSHCDRAVVWKGPWRDVKGGVWTVEACDQHRPDVE
jgi:hypothetical protein